MKSKDMTKLKKAELIVIAKRNAEHAIAAGEEIKRLRAELVKRDELVEQLLERLEKARSLWKAGMFPGQKNQNRRTA